jgi:hypothetical protein
VQRRSWISPLIERLVVLVILKSVSQVRHATDSLKDVLVPRTLLPV